MLTPNTPFRWIIFPVVTSFFLILLQSAAAEPVEPARALRVADVLAQAHSHADGLQVWVSANKTLNHTTYLSGDLQVANRSGSERRGTLLASGIGRRLRPGGRLARPRG